MIRDLTVISMTNPEDRARFGPYRIVRRVGSGGMGTVFEAEDLALGSRVALKVLHPHVANRRLAVERFMREGRAAARIRHPHVVQVLALGIEGETPYLAMELLEGEDLARVVERRGRLPVHEALDLVLPVVAAVAAAHDAGIIHRDLKPSNLCITRGPSGQPWPKVVDFGVSKVVVGDGTSEATVTEGVVGTAAYMAPEQARAARNASFQSDQYSLAALLYECATGERPFSGSNAYEVVKSIMTRPLVMPSARVPGIPAQFDRAVECAMSRRPDGRFPSVRSFGAALLPLASERTRLALAPELEQHATALSTETPRAFASGVTGPTGSHAGKPTWDDTSCATLSSEASGTRPPTKRPLWFGGVVLGAILGALAAAAVWRGASSWSEPARASAGHHNVEAGLSPGTNERSERAAPRDAENPDDGASGETPAAPAASRRPFPPPVPARPAHRTVRQPVARDEWTMGDNDAPILP
jgi:serine/threonine-protein kinase